MRKKVFIIGNGFDLNLGWKTSYKDFISSEYWPLKNKEPYCLMAEYLKERTEVDRWYDLENLLKAYASDSHNNHDEANPRDEEFFYELRDSLMAFLRAEVAKNLNTESMAAKVLNAVVANGYFSSIYTFNYTDLYDIAERTGINERFDYEPVHGCLSNNSIILGVNDGANLRKGYSYLRKVFSEHYTSHSIRYDLQECDEVVFFGHSLGENDYPYFADFFESQSNCAERKNGKHITIFTKDNHSRFQILDQLRMMNGGMTERLQNDNDFKIIMTDNPNKVLLKKFFDNLDKESLSTHERQMEHVASMLL